MPVFSPSRSEAPAGRREAATVRRIGNRIEAVNECFSFLFLFRFYRLIISNFGGWVNAEGRELQNSMG